MPWLHHLAFLFAFLATFVRPVPALALAPASPETGVGGFEVAGQLLANELGAANREHHQGIGAGYDENASGYRFAAGGAARASSAAQGALLRAQLAAEEVAGARLPQAITGYTRHGLNQAISREGVGVSPRAILDAFENPLSITGQSSGRFVLTGTDAVVIVNVEGQVIHTWATGSAGFRIVP
jgi:hypothetical protein